MPAPILLIGNQNAGKTSLFNTLTGLKSRVANYPGVTTEACVGEIRRFTGESVEVIDLPGTYSLIPASDEEELTVKVLLGMIKSLKNYSLIVVVIDCQELRRGLYLYAQIMELGFKAIIALSMADQKTLLWQKQAVSLLKQHCSSIVVPISINDAASIAKLTHTIDGILAGSFYPQIPKLPLWHHHFKPNLLTKLSLMTPLLTLPKHIKNSPDLLFNFNIFSYNLAKKHRLALTEQSLTHLHLTEQEANELDSFINDIPEKRFQAIDKWLKELKDDYQDKRVISDAIDKVVLHPFLGTTLLLVLIFLMMQSLFTLAKPLADILTLGVEHIALNVGNILPKASLLHSLLVDGIFLGLGSIVAFMPLIALLFLFLSLLEDSGYLARATYLLDNTMKKWGLCGRSLMPMLSSFACAVPAILASRTIPSYKKRLITVMVLPFLICSARLPVFGLIIASLFSSYPPLWGFFDVGGILFIAMYVLSLVVSLFFAFILAKILRVNQEDSLAIELPPYRWPNPINVIKKIADRLYLFMRDVGGIILAATIIIWALLHLPSDILKDGDINTVLITTDHEHSLAGKMGKAIEPLLSPLGLDWRIGVGIIASFLAREVFISTMSVVYGFDHQEDMIGLKNSFSEHISLASGLSLLVFFALSMQCVSTLAATHRETGSWLWPMMQFIMMTGSGYLLSYLTYMMATNLL